MGQISIKASGSFSEIDSSVDLEAVFSAMKHGHARCVTDVIQWLAEVVLPHAIKLDHRLHEKGSVPSDGFGMAEKD